MYIVGQANNPKYDKHADRWTLEIHRVSDKDINDIEHYGCIEIHDDTLDLCLLKAKIICAAFNEKGFSNTESMIEKLNLQKANIPLL